RHQHHAGAMPLDDDEMVLVGGTDATRVRHGAEARAHRRLPRAEMPGEHVVLRGEPGRVGVAIIALHGWTREEPSAVASILALAGGEFKGERLSEKGTEPLVFAVSPCRSVRSQGSCPLFG